MSAHTSSDATPEGIARIDALIDRLRDGVIYKDENLCWFMAPDAIAALRRYRELLASVECAAPSSGVML